MRNPFITLKCEKSIYYVATITVQTPSEKGPKLKAIPCQAPKDCKNVDGAYCDVDQKLCLCKPDYPVTDTNQCFKGSTELAFKFCKKRSDLCTFFFKSPSMMNFVNWISNVNTETKTPSVIETSVCVNARIVMSQSRILMGNNGA